MCRILSMSGGGSKGAYEAGVIHTMFNTGILPPSENQYDVVSGVSVGAINSGAFSLFAKGDEIQLGEFMMNLWENITNDKVYKLRETMDPVEPLFWEAGYVDDSPLFDFLKNIFDEFGNICRRTVITTANDVLTGR